MTVRPPTGDTSSPSSPDRRAPANGEQSVDNLMAVLLKDLETRIHDWNGRVEAEKAQLQQEWQALEEEKAKVRNRAKHLDDSANDVGNALKEVQRLREELEKRLAVTPMDLDAAQLQQEWRKIDKERLDLKKATEELQLAFDRLADAQAALEMLQ